MQSWEKKTSVQVEPEFLIYYKELVSITGFALHEVMFLGAHLDKYSMSGSNLGFLLHVKKTHEHHKNEKLGVVIIQAWNLLNTFQIIHHIMNTYQHTVETWIWYF